MKVLWLMPYFGNNAIGGAEISNLNYIHDLVEFDHVVITNHFNNNLGQGKFENIIFYNLNDRDILSCIKTQSPDLIICTHELVVFPYQLDIPYIIYLHDPRSSCSNLLTNFCNYDCSNCVYFNLHDSFILPFKKARNIICCSKYLIRTVRNQISCQIHQLPIYPNIRLTKSKSKGHANVIGLSSVDYHKGGKILEKLLPYFPEYEFIICGHKKLNKSFPNVVYTGYLSNNDIYCKFYSKIGTFLSLAINGESFGMTIVEAFSNNLPVLFPYADGIAESAGFDWFSVPYERRNCLVTWTNYLRNIVESNSIRKSLIDESVNVISRYKIMKSCSINNLRDLIYNI